MFSRLSSWTLALAVLACPAIAGSKSVDPQTDGGTDLDFSIVETTVDATSGAVETIIATSFDQVISTELSQQLVSLQTALPGCAGGAADNHYYHNHAGGCGRNICICNDARTASRSSQPLDCHHQSNRRKRSASWDIGGAAIVGAKGSCGYCQTNGNQYLQGQ